MSGGNLRAGFETEDDSAGSVSHSVHRRGRGRRALSLELRTFDLLETGVRGDERAGEALHAQHERAVGIILGK